MIANVQSPQVRIGPPLHPVTLCRIFPPEGAVCSQSTISLSKLAQHDARTVDGGHPPR
jgi:hypothetical protein